MRRRVRNLTLVAAAVAALATAVVSTVGPIRFTYTSEELRITLETAQALIGFLVTHLLYGRFRRTQLRRDLVLVYGMGLFAAANLFFLLGPLLGSRFETSAFQAWAPLATRNLAALAIATAAWMPRHRAVQRVPAVLVLGLHLLSLLVVIITVSVLQDHLPLAVETSLPTGGIQRPVIEGHPVLAGAQLVLMGLFWLAAAGFVRRADSDPGRLTTALAVGFVLTGFSRLNFFLYPSLYTDVIHVGDLLRLAGYLVMLAGAGEEISSYWRGLAEAAVDEERRRTARDLHDGLVQELSFIRSRVSSLASGKVDGLVVDQIAGAADRALNESRQAIQALSGGHGQDVAGVVRRAAEEVAGRGGARVELHVPACPEVGPEVAEALSRIVREASSNAVRHGKARNITVCLERLRKEGVRLKVSDDGAGFDPQAVKERAGYGLRSMEERVAGLGGDFRLSSAPDEGTTVEVVIPGGPRGAG